MEFLAVFVLGFYVSVILASSFEKFDLVAGISNKVCNAERVVFGVLHTSSLIRCALLCSLHKPCKSFFYSSNTATCIGCTEACDSGDHTDNLPGSVCYIKDIIVSSAPVQSSADMDSQSTEYYLFDGCFDVDEECEAPDCLSFVASNVDASAATCYTYAPPNGVFFAFRMNGTHFSCYLAFVDSGPKPCELGGTEVYMIL